MLKSLIMELEQQEYALTRIFHKLPAERRLGVGFAASPCPKPVANRRSTLSAFPAVCNIQVRVCLKILVFVGAEVTRPKKSRIKNNAVLNQRL